MNAHFFSERFFIHHTSQQLNLFDTFVRMTKVDFIIVGCGLAGIAFCEELRKDGRSFMVFDDASQQSSKVAGGLYNPVVLKRFSAAWKANTLIEFALPYYYEIENYLQVKLVHETSILRIFNSTEEQNNWFAASDKPDLQKFLDDKIHQNSNPNVNAKYGMGLVLNTGRIDTTVLVNSYFEYLEKKGEFNNDSFEYDALLVENDFVRYKNLQAEHVVFTEGFGLKHNPYFNYLPLIGSKGEYIMVKAPELRLDHILKGSIFIIPIKKDEYLVGATYDNVDKTDLPTEHKKDELMTKLRKMINCEFEVVDHITGIRPTVKDRRPLVGRHPKYNNLFVLNGLGTRGIMASPYIANLLFDHIEHNIGIESEIDVKRYESLFIS